MEDNFLELKEYIEQLENYTLPDYKEISQIPLYMEQVIGYIDEVLAPLSQRKEGSETVITPFMVNNYVKAKVLTAPKNKKYNKEQIAYLLAICLLKKSASMKDIATLIELDHFLEDDKQKLYTMFKNLQDDILKQQAHKVKVRLETLEKASKKKQDKLEENLNLSFIALRLYIESEISKTIAESILDKISKDVLPSEALKPSKKVNALENKKEHKEAKKLSSRK